VRERNHFGLRMFGEVLAIRWNWLLGRYPQSGEA
jgi:hypothetical protein